MQAIIAFELAGHWCSCRFWTSNSNSSLLKAIVLLDSSFGCVKAPYCAVTTFPQGASSDSIVLLGICMYVTDNRKVGDKSTRRLLETSENLSVCLSFRQNFPVLVIFSWSECLLLLSRYMLFFISASHFSVPIHILN
jgi:hypothetical protein